MIANRDRRTSVDQIELDSIDQPFRLWNSHERERIATEGLGLGGEPAIRSVLLRPSHTPGAQERLVPPNVCVFAKIRPAYTLYP